MLIVTFKRPVIFQLRNWNDSPITLSTKAVMVDEIQTGKFHVTDVAVSEGGSVTWWGHGMKGLPCWLEIPESNIDGRQELN